MKHVDKVRVGELRGMQSENESFKS